MKEVKYHCDRCGKEIECPSRSCFFEGAWFKYQERRATITYTSVQQRQRIIDESNNNITEDFDPLAMSKFYTEPVVIETERRRKRKESELCPKCYREFLRFMKGEKKDESAD